MFLIVMVRPSLVDIDIANLLPSVKITEGRLLTTLALSCSPKVSSYLNVRYKDSESLFVVVVAFQN